MLNQDSRLLFSAIFDGTRMQLPLALKKYQVFEAIVEPQFSKFRHSHQHASTVRASHTRPQFR